MQPGGKIEIDETAEQALARELKEELNLVVSGGDLSFCGRVVEAAAFEKMTDLDAELYSLRILGDPEPQREIERCIWVSPFNPGGIALAPLTANHALPLAGRIMSESGLRGELTSPRI